MNASIANIDVVCAFVSQQSSVGEKRYVFTYTITITNTSDTPIQLISRHWHITDGTGKVEEVYGEGVVGKQPHIKPGGVFRYTSGSVLSTEIGTMEGQYVMRCQNGKKVGVSIPKFVLSIPRTIH